MPSSPDPRPPAGRPQRPIRVAVISHSQVVRDGLTSLVGQLGHHALVTHAGVPDEKLAQHAADVALCDAGEVAGRAERLRRHADLAIPAVAIVYETAPPDDRHGATLSLAVTSEQLLTTLRGVLSGRAPQPTAQTPLPADLSERELEILGLIALGSRTPRSARGSTSATTP